LRVGFVLHSKSRLAHTETLITFLRGLARLPSPPIEPLVYLAKVDSSVSELAATLAEFRAPLATLANAAPHPVAWLRDSAIQDGLAAMVFVSNTTNLAFAAGYGVAPVLVWWTMKYHSLELPGIDAYLSNGTFFDDWRVIDGRRWRSCRAALPPLTDATTAAEGRRFRAEHGLNDNHVILACIGREEKLLDARYIDALGRILEACPQARYMWSGREIRAGEVMDLMRQRGILDRCRFVGWLPNTKLAAQAMDIYADSFPFASGHTAYEAMAAGKPVVVLKTHEALESSSANSLVPAYEGHIGTPAEQAAVRALLTDTDGASLLPYVDTVDQYVDLAIRLVRDPHHRAKVGDACRLYVERFTRDEVTFAQSTCRHLLEIVKEKADAGGGTIAF
jgi:glycosyltransferase involved in cell wall biosynthesis